MLNLLLFVLLVTISPLAHPQTPAPRQEHAAESVRTQYAAARNARDSLTRQSKTLLGQSTEGARATAYFDRDKHLRSIDVTYYGETGRARYEFYFVATNLVLARERQFTYNAPIYFTPKVVKQMLSREGINQAAFDARKTKVVEHFFRFEGERLAEHIGPEVTMDGSPWSAIKESTRMRKTATEVLSEFAPR